MIDEQSRGDEGFRHVYNTNHRYWCGGEAVPGISIVTADGALFGIERRDRIICKDCLSAIVARIEQYTGEGNSAPSCSGVMVDSLGRVAVMAPLEMIGRYLQGLGEELRQPLESVNWRSVQRMLIYMDMQLKTAASIAQICDAIYGKTGGES